MRDDQVDLLFPLVLRLLVLLLQDRKQKRGRKGG